MKRSEVAKLAERMSWPRHGEFTADLEGLAHDHAHTAARFRQPALSGGSSYDSSVIVLADRMNRALAEPIETLREAELFPSQ